MQIIQQRHRLCLQLNEKTLEEMEYAIDIFDNHLILVDQKKKLLIDTGSPISISNEGEIEIFGMTYRSSKNYLGLNIEGISKGVEYDLNALIGGDILKNHIFQIDFKNLEAPSTAESDHSKDCSGGEANIVYNLTVSAP